MAGLLFEFFDANEKVLDQPFTIGSHLVPQTASNGFPPCRKKNRPLDRKFFHHVLITIRAQAIHLHGEVVQAACQESNFVRIISSAASLSYIGGEGMPGAKSGSCWKGFSGLDPLLKFNLTPGGLKIRVSMPSPAIHFKEIYSG
jgi:hypothetical protein